MNRIIYMGGNGSICAVKGVRLGTCDLLRARVKKNVRLQYAQK